MVRHACKSLWNRRFVALLSMLAVAVSAALVLGIERLRNEARSSFANSASGVDVIIAARGNSIQILMASIFGVGSTSAGMSWKTYETMADLPPVDWSVPIMLGDNHRGMPVIGTTPDYFTAFVEGSANEQVFAKGTVFNRPDGAVIGAEVANRFDYDIGKVIINAHGAGAIDFDQHENAPFTIQGILAPTGRALDRMVFVTLAGFDAIHREIAPPPVDPMAIVANPAPDNAPPTQINAMLVGLKERRAVLGVQQFVAQYPNEPMSAVLPGLALLELWEITGTAETALRLLTWATALVGFASVLVMLTSTLDARRREFAILRSVGATPARILSLIVIEAIVITMAGLVLGLLLATLAAVIVQPLLATRYGLVLSLGLFSVRELLLLSLLFVAGLIASIVPAVRVYRITLNDGLSVKL